MSSRAITPGSGHYPPTLTAFLGAASSISALTLRAADPDQLPWDQPLLALFCSSKAPAGILLAVHDLAHHWRCQGPSIISGFHSPVEQEALTILLRPPGRAVVCPARGIKRMRIKRAWPEAFDDGRLSLLSPFPDTVRRPTRQTAYRRNRLVAWKPSSLNRSTSAREYEVNDE